MCAHTLNHVHVHSRLTTWVSLWPPCGRTDNGFAILLPSSQRPHWGQVGRCGLAKASTNANGASVSWG